jgi:glutamate racemase
MSTVAVFDSGFGSLSVIKAIQKHTKADIIYFADQKNFPYGKKTKSELEQIIKNTITLLQQKFNPTLIVVGSNTPSLLLDKIFSDDPKIIGVFPPLLEAQQLTKTNSIALLVTSSVAKSTSLNNFIQQNLTKKIQILKIDSSDLVELVESGKFIDDKNFCMKKIISVLQKKFIDNNVDVATLSSTHLPFLLPLLEKIFPHIRFLDSSDKVAIQIVNHKAFSSSTRNTLRIFSSGNVKTLQKNLHKISIKKSVQQIIW